MSTPVGMSPSPSGTSTPLLGGFGSGASTPTGAPFLPTRVLDSRWVESIAVRFYCPSSPQLRGPLASRTQRGHSRSRPPPAPPAATRSPAGGGTSWRLSGTTRGAGTTPHATTSATPSTRAWAAGSAVPNRLHMLQPRPGEALPCCRARPGSRQAGRAALPSRPPAPCRLVNIPWYRFYTIFVLAYIGMVSAAPWAPRALGCCASVCRADARIRRLHCLRCTAQPAQHGRSTALGCAPRRAAHGLQRRASPAGGRQRSCTLNRPTAPHVRSPFNPPLCPAPLCCSTAPLPPSTSRSRGA